MVKQLSAVEGLLTTTFLILLVRVAYLDWQTRKIPDRYIGSLFLVAMLALVFVKEPGLSARVGGVFAASVPMFLITILVPGAFGGGDIKLMAACGMFLGAGEIFSSFFYALVLGGAYSLYLIFHKNKSVKEEFAFGPFLVAGMILRAVFHLF